MKPLTYADQMLIWRRRRERALAMHQAGLTLDEIAQQLKCTRQRVHQILQKTKAAQPASA